MHLLDVLILFNLPDQFGEYVPLHPRWVTLVVSPFMLNYAHTVEYCCMFDSIFLTLIFFSILQKHRFGSQTL